MENNIIPSILFGAMLTIGGCALLWFHLRAWNKGPFSRLEDPAERTRYRLRFRRRLQVAVLLVVLGIMIPVGDALFGLRRSPLLLTVYWMIVILLALWVMLLALFDWISSRSGIRAARNELAGLERKRRELEEEIARMRSPRSTGETNGRH
jgi:ABC-type multidrug transport system fused ATPase/permease subunit